MTFLGERRKVVLDIVNYTVPEKLEAVARKWRYLSRLSAVITSAG